VLGVLACLALILVPVLRRRRAAPEATGLGAVVQPEGVSALHHDGAPLALTAALAAGLVAGVLGVVFGSVVIGLVLAVTTFVAARASWGQVALRALSAGMFAAAAGFIVVKQLRNDYVVDFNWVGRFETAHAWALIAVFALMASVVIDALRARGSAADGVSGSAAPPPPAAPASTDRSAR
jgi:hypothetical protein